jgi:hypothetical protein
MVCVKLNKLSIFAWAMILLFLTFGVSGQIIPSVLEDPNAASEGRWTFLWLFCLLVILHEGLHAVAVWHWGKVPFHDIHFGFRWQWLAPYCHCKVPLKMGVCRRVLVLPFLVTVPIAALILWLSPSFWMLVLFGLMVAGCTADLMMFFKLRSFEDNLWVQDHPFEPACNIFLEQTNGVITDKSNLWP